MSIALIASDAMMLVPQCQCNTGHEAQIAFRDQMDEPESPDRVIFNFTFQPYICRTCGTPYALAIDGRKVAIIADVQP